MPFGQGEKELTRVYLPLLRARHPASDDQAGFGLQLESRRIASLTPGGMAATWGYLKEDDVLIR